MTRTINRSLLLALFVATGMGATVLLPSTASAAADDTIAFQAKKLTAPQMLAKQQQAVAFILKSYKAIDAKKRGKSAPFLKALASTAKSIEAVKTAAEAKDIKAFANALPVLAQSIATLDQSYRLSKLKNKKIATGMKTLNAMWDLYLRRVVGGKATKPDDMAKSDGRRIHDMEKRLDRMAQNQKITERQKKELEHMRKLLAKAKANNRKAGQQWYTAYILADFAGYYAGCYYWYAAYDPTYVAYYQASWEYFSQEVTFSYQESYSYYESYSFESYEQTSVETSESYDFNYSAEEYAAFDSEYEATDDQLDQATDEEYQATDLDDEIEAADDYDDPNQTVDDAGDNPDDEADAASSLDDEQASADDNTDNDEAYLNDDDGGDEQSTADDDGGDDQMDSSDEGGDDNADAADDGGDDSMDSSDGGDDSEDDGGADDGGSDDGGGDDGGGDDGGGDE